MDRPISVLAIPTARGELTELAATLRKLLPHAEIRAASSPSQGLDQAATALPDVILIDAAASMDAGIETCQRLKADGRLKHIPVVIIYPPGAGAAGRARALEAGADGLLAQPLDASELTAQIRAMAKINAANTLGRRAGDASPSLQSRRDAALLALPRAAERMDEPAFMQYGQELAEDLTGSQVSFIHFVADDERTIELVTWSRRTLATYCQASYESHYPVEDAGIWADALRQHGPVIINDYPAASNKQGLPEGHAQLDRFMSVPVIENDQVVMLAGVGNKSTPYTDADVETVQLIGSEIWRIVQRRRAENALRDIAETTEELFWVATPDQSRMLYVSPAYERIWGRPSEWLYRSPRDYLQAVHPDDMALAVQSTSADEARLEREYRIIRPDGQIRWIRSRAYPVRDGSGRVERVVGTAVDITERKLAETTATRLGRILDESANEIYVFDADTLRFTQVNRGAQQNLGYSLRELEELTPLDIKPAYNQETFQELVAPLRHGDLERVTFETVHRRKDGSLYPVEIALQLAANETPPVFVAIVLDITEREKIEADRDRLISAVEQAAESMVITDTTGAIQYVNPAFEQVTGYSRAEAIGQNPRILKSGVHDDAFYRDMWRTLAGGDVWRGRIVNRKKDGSLFTEEVVITPIRDEAGRTTNYVSAKRDITNELVLEDQLRQAQKMEAVGRLAGGIAHDFNNMLNVILGYGEGIYRQLAPGDPWRDDMADILAAARRSASLTQQLLAFSRRQMLQPRVLDLNMLVADVETRLRQLLGDTIWLELALQRDIGLVRVDPEQIEQAILDLATNSRDAMPAGGRLRIETSSVTFDQDYAESHPEVAAGAYTMLSVADTGRGMAPEVLDDIFEPFYTTKDASEGAGLGLSTVYGTVKQSGGHIWVESEPGRGTTFNICFPQVGAERERAEAVAPESRLPGGSERILVVEGDRSLRELVDRLLSRLGYAATVVADGDQALSILETIDPAPELLIMDAAMLTMGVRELAGRARRAHPGIKLLCMSCYTENVADEEDWAALDAVVMQKPFTVAMLAAKVREALGD